MSDGYNQSYYIIVAIAVVVKLICICCYCSMRRGSDNRTCGTVITDQSAIIRRTEVCSVPNSDEAGVENPNYMPPSYISTFGQNQVAAAPTYGQVVNSPEYVCQSDRKSLIV